METLHRQLTNAEIGDRLRLIRQARQRTQCDLGKAIGASQNKISDMEKGVCTASVPDLGSISKVLCFDMDVFYHSHPFDLMRCLRPMPDKEGTAADPTSHGRVPL